MARLSSPPHIFYTFLEGSCENEGVKKGYKRNKSH